jgi:hypothetical protein
MDNLLNIDLLNSKIDEYDLIRKDNNINLVYFNINREAVYPFMQILLLNNYIPFPIFGNIMQNFVFPKISYNPKSNINININELILSFLKENVESIGFTVSNEELSNIFIKGFNLFSSEIYIFIDISCIKLDRLFLNKKSEIWFALISEIVNSRNICRINISDDVNDFVTNNIDLFSNIDNILYPTPEIAYVGSYFNKVEFQSLFGIAKSEKKYGNYYYFSYSFEDALKDGSWTKYRNPEFRFGKIITDDDNGRYIEGGVNRIAILLDKCKYIKEEEIDKMTNLDELTDYFLEYDCIYILSKNYNVTIMMKDYNRQYPLSYHKINKKTLSGKIDII